MGATTDNYWLMGCYVVLAAVYCRFESRLARLLTQGGSLLGRATNPQAGATPPFDNRILSLCDCQEIGLGSGLGDRYLQILDQTSASMVPPAENCSALFRKANLTADCVVLATFGLQQKHQQDSNEIPMK